MSSVDSKMKGEYEERLKKELKQLRKLYKASMKKSQEEFMRTYNQKVSKERKGDSRISHTHLDNISLYQKAGGQCSRFRESCFQFDVLLFETGYCTLLIIVV